MDLQRCQCPQNPKTHDYGTLHDKKDLGDGLTLRVQRYDYPELPEWAYVIPRVLKKGRQQYQIQSYYNRSRGQREI